MTENIVTLPRMDLHFGNCPECHKTHGCYSVGPDHWQVCHIHRTKWLIGSNLFSCWHDLSEQQVFANAYMLAGYREVEPWLPDDVQERQERESRENRSRKVMLASRALPTGVFADSSFVARPKG